MTGSDRAAVLADRWAAVRKRVARACADAGRDPGEVTLVAVTKTYPASDVLILRELGATDVAESREPEASEKVAAVAAVPGPPLRWHFVGQIQSRKARAIAGYAAVVHSLDRAAIADRLGAARPADAGPLAVLIQVSLDGDPNRGGVVPDAVGGLAEHVTGIGALRLAGVMAVAPMDVDPAVAFARLREVSDRLRTDYPDASWISAGMSNDLEAAVKNGATHVRVGSALLGERTP